MKSKAFILSIAFLFNLYLNARAQSPQSIARNTFPSTTLVVMEDKQAQPLSLGSGFFIKPNLVVTNFHVIEGAYSGYVKPVNSDNKIEIEGVINSDPDHDLAILKVSGNNSSSINIGNSDNLEVGDKVFAIGNPKGLEGTFSEGIISSIRKIDSSNILQITAPISPGSSGGPVLDKSGDLVGVAFATFKDGQNLNFAIPSKYLAKLVHSQSQNLESLTSVRESSNSIFASEIGNKSSESIVGSHFNWTDNQYMGKYTFSVRNKLREPVKNVICSVIFYANDGYPIDTKFINIEGPIPGKLAERSPKLGRISADEIRNITSNVEIRILDFQVVR